MDISIEDLLMSTLPDYQLGPIASCSPEMKRGNRPLSRLWNKDTYSVVSELFWKMTSILNDHYPLCITHGIASDVSFSLLEMFGAATTKDMIKLREIAHFHRNLFANSRTFGESKPHKLLNS